MDLISVANLDYAKRHLFAARRNLSRGHLKDDFGEELGQIDAIISKLKQALEKSISPRQHRSTVDEEMRKWIVSMAYTVFNNDGIEEFVPELESFSMEAITLRKGEMRDLPDKKLVKVATHAAFVAMLGGFKVDEAVDIVLKNRDDILEVAFWR